MLKQSVLDNLFYGAHDAARELSVGLWHPGRGNQVDADVPQSSQALALDVFGTLRHAKSRNRICDHLAILLGVETGGPWEVVLEFEDPDNLLQETHHKSQVDVVLRGNRSLIVLECKFTETSLESCSQIGKTKKGLVQCDGNYEMQVNPSNQHEDFCALSGKGIRYWEYIPKVFQLPAREPHRPCPFSGAWYQWMRTLVMAYALGERHHLHASAAVAFVGRPAMPLLERVRAESEVMRKKLTGVVKFELLRIEKAPAMFEAAAEKGEKPMFHDLQQWVNAKVNWVEARMLSERMTRRILRR
jgi:hypothetical protein